MGELVCKCYYTQSLGNTVVFYAEIPSCPDSDSHRQENSTEGNEPAVADMVMSEERITGSCSGGNSYLNGNSERSDFYSVGEDITKSMMTVLLPQAVPLLTYSSRKKQRRTKPSEGSPSGKKQENELKGIAPSADVIPPGIVQFNLVCQSD